VWLSDGGQCGRGQLVVLDRARAFGAPIDVLSGIRTDILNNAFQAQPDADAVADWIEVPAERVCYAIESEGKWLKAA